MRSLCMDKYMPVFIKRRYMDQGRGELGGWKSYAVWEAGSLHKVRV